MGQNCDNLSWTKFWTQIYQFAEVGQVKFMFKSKFFSPIHLNKNSINPHDHQISTKSVSNTSWCNMQPEIFHAIPFCAICVEINTQKRGFIERHGRNPPCSRENPSSNHCPYTDCDYCPRFSQLFWQNGPFHYSLTEV